MWLLQLSLTMSARIPAKPSLFSSAAQRGCLLLEMGREPKRRAFVQLAFNPDLALHHPDQLPGDGKSQASAAILAGRRVIGLAERLKEVLLCRRTDSDACVFHLESQHTPSLSSRLCCETRKTTSPCLVNLIALLRIFVRIWRNRPASPRRLVKTV